MITAPRRVNAPINIADGASPREMWESVVDYVARDLPEMKHAEIYVPAAQQTTLFSVPVTLVPGIAGKVLLITHLHIRKPLGTAWTTAGSGVLGVRFGSAGSFQVAQYDQAVTTDFFQAAANVWVAEAGSGNTSTIGWTTGTASSNGAALKLAFNSGDISGGSGSLIVNIWYREWDGI